MTLGIPLLPWHTIAALWEARALIGAVILTGLSYAWLMRRHPMIAVMVLAFVTGLIRGLLGGRRR